MEWYKKIGWPHQSTILSLPTSTTTQNFTSVFLHISYPLNHFSNLYYIKMAFLHTIIAICFIIMNLRSIHMYIILCFSLGLYTNNVQYVYTNSSIRIKFLRRKRLDFTRIYIFEIPMPCIYTITIYTIYKYS